VNAWQLYQELHDAMNKGDGSGKASDDIIVIDHNGNTHPITNVHYNPSLGVYVISLWKRETV
jgi:hypothetical protein